MEPFFVNVITATAYCKQPTDGISRLDGEHEEGTRDKICMILMMVRYHSVEHLVLTAFGCGAFGNPPPAT